MDRLTDRVISIFPLQVYNASLIRGGCLIHTHHYMQWALNWNTNQTPHSHLCIFCPQLAIRTPMEYTELLRTSSSSSRIIFTNTGYRVSAYMLIVGPTASIVSPSVPTAKDFSAVELVCLCAINGEWILNASGYWSEQSEDKCVLHLCAVIKVHDIHMPILSFAFLIAANIKHYRFGFWRAWLCWNDLFLEKYWHLFYS